MSMNPRRVAFVENYLIEANATQAALKAGYSPKTAGQQGFDLLKNPEIQVALKAARDERSERTRVTGDMVVRELALLAFADIGDIVTWDAESMSVVPSADIGDIEWQGDRVNKRRSIASVKIVRKRRFEPDGAGGYEEWEVETQEVKMCDKLGALKELAKHTGVVADTGITIDARKQWMVFGDLTVDDIIRDPAKADAVHTLLGRGAG